MASLRFGRRSVLVSRGKDHERPAGGAGRSAQADGATESGDEQNTIPPLRDIEGAPGTPLELGRTGWWHVIKRAGKEFTADRCTTTAGSL
ncbi:MAG TPA: hypothetical protein VIZ43_06925, partial [Trebonia sp.]